MGGCVTTVAAWVVASISVIRDSNQSSKLRSSIFEGQCLCPPWLLQAVCKLPQGHRAQLTALRPRRRMGSYSARRRHWPNEPQLTTQAVLRKLHASVSLQTSHVRPARPVQLVSGRGDRHTVPSALHHLPRILCVAFSHFESRKRGLVTSKSKEILMKISSGAY